MYKNVEVEICLDDILEYISDYATARELEEIREALGQSTELFDCRLDGSYIREEKITLLGRAANKYTLEELEKRLGNKFDLI